MSVFKSISDPQPAKLVRQTGRDYDVVAVVVVLSSTTAVVVVVRPGCDVCRRLKSERSCCSIGSVDFSPDIRCHWRAETDRNDYIRRFSLCCGYEDRRGCCCGLESLAHENCYRARESHCCGSCGYCDNYVDGLDHDDYYGLDRDLVGCYWWI